ncbi:MAG: polyprenol monophosphomannose synthase [Nocardioidaceae bacterium]|nr:polyprenol monophosphomannose synthase [Nocardioidaceae bacterium]
MPTYNEADNIELVIDRVRASVPALDVLVVDDSSPDGTGEIADKVAGHDAKVQVLHRPAKAGLGVAYLAGFGWGMEHGYDVLIEMDADGSHLPEQLPRLLEALHGADLVLGARWVRDGRVMNWPRRRELLSRGGNAYVRLALGLPLHDATSGFRAFRRTTLEGVDLESVTSQGYCFQVDLARRTLAAGFTVAEVPITFVEREYGESKMNGPIVREALIQVSRWALAHRIAQARRLISGRQVGG